MRYLRSGLLVLLLALSPAAQAQETSIDLPYLDPALAQEAFAAEDAGDYARSAQVWKQIVEAGKPYPNLFFLAARGFALADQPDEAFHYFEQAVATGFLSIGLLRDMPELEPLRNDPRWDALVEQVEAKHAALDEALRAELLAMAEADQEARKRYRAVLQRHGAHTPQADSAWAKVEAVDAPHEERLKQLVARHGWLTRSLVGEDGAHAAWLIVQHASGVFQAEVLPLLLKAAEEGEARWDDAAMLQDRVLVFHEGKPQIYGSQLRENTATGRLELAPIQDEAHVDERRAAVRLIPLAEYLKGFGLAYEPSATDDHE